MTLTGAVCNNRAEKAGGGICDAGLNLTLGGACKVTGNTAGTTDNIITDNVSRRVDSSSSRIFIDTDNPLATEATIGVNLWDNANRKYTTGVIIDRGITEDNKSCFSSDNSAFELQKDNDQLKLVPHVHTWRETTLEATSSQEGRKRRECEGCHQLETESIPKTGDSHQVTVKVITRPGAPETTTNTEIEDFLNESNILTSEEKEKIANNTATATIWLQVEPRSEEEVLKAEKNKIIQKAESIVGSGADLSYFDITLWKQLSTASTATQISEPGIPISITMKLPEDKKNTDASKNRSYYVLRVHGGGYCEVAKPGAISPTGSTGGDITFTTNVFSIYALTYQDVEKPSASGSAKGSDAKGSGAKGNAQSDGEAGDNSNTNPVQAVAVTNTAAADTAGNTVTPTEVTTAPRTGDEANPIGWMMVLVLGMVGVIGITGYRRRDIDRKKEKYN